MGAPSTNSLQKVETYLTDHSLPLLASMLTVTQLFDGEYKDWDKLEGMGTRGNAFKVRKPTRFSVTNSLSFDAQNSGSFTEEFLEIVAGQEGLVNFAMTDQQLATYDFDQITKMMGQESMAELAETIDGYNATMAATTGYRFLGSPLVADSQMTTYNEITRALTKFRSFGGKIKAHVILPMTESAMIAASGLQQFVTKRNDDWSIDGLLGDLTGNYNATFYQSTLLPQHISGTASASAGIQITSVANTTVTMPGTITAVAGSTIVLAGLTAGQTILADDVGDIGAVASTAAGGAVMRYLSYVGHIGCANDVQFRVITGDTASSGGVATITVIPQLVYDSTNVDPQRNLPRAIVTGSSGDKVRIAKSHQTGVVFLDGYMKWVCPRLGTKSPYVSASEQYSDSAYKISLRAYHGALMGTPTSQFVHDIMYGSSGAAEGVARILFPLND